MDFDWKTANRKGDAQAHREFWCWIGQALVELHRSNKPLPEEVLVHLIRVADDLSAGRISPVIQKVVTRGRLEPDVMESSDIGWGVAYLRACEDGRIDDKHPTKTVADAFGVNKRTVQGWNKSISPAKIASTLPGEVLRDQLEKAGSLYKVAGRSRDAVVRRYWGE